MEDYSTGGLGGLGGYMNNLSTNPFFLAGLQMVGNNTPQIGRIPNPMQGVPQILFQSGTAATNRADELAAQRQTQALFNNLLGPSGNAGTAAPTQPAYTAPAQANTPATASPGEVSTPDYAGGQSHFSDTFNQVKSNDPGTIAANFKDLGSDYGGLTIAEAADKLAQTNKTSAARLLQAAKQLDIPTDTQLTDQLIEDPKVGPALMKAFMGQSYKLSADQWAQAHSTWNDNRTAIDQAQQQQEPLPQGAFKNAPTGTAQQAPGSMVIGATPQDQAIIDQANRAQQQQSANVSAPPQPAYSARPQTAQQVGQNPNLTMNQMPPGPTPQQRAVSQQAAQIMQPQPTAAPQQPAAPAANLGAPGRFSLAGADPRMMAAVIANPHASPQVKAALLQRMNPQLHFQAVTDSWGNQNIVALDPYTGQVVAGGPATGGPNSGGAAGGQGLQQIVQKVAAARDAGVTDVGKLADMIPDKATAEYTKAILRGDAVPAYLGNRAGPLRANAIAMAHAIDPNFSEEQITARMAFSRAMHSTAQNSWDSQVRSSQTILEHTDQALNALSHVLKGSKNVPGGAYGDIAALNWLRSMANQNSKDPVYLEAKGAYDQAVEAVAKEKIRLLTGNEGTKEERLSEAGKLDITKRPVSEVIGAWKETYNIMRGRLTPIALQKQNAFGTPVDPDSLLPASAQKTIERLKGLGTGTIPLEGAATGPSTRAVERGPDGQLRYKQ